MEQLKRMYGFDSPPVERFVTMMGNYLVFDFGKSTTIIGAWSIWSSPSCRFPCPSVSGVFSSSTGSAFRSGIAKAVRDGSSFDVITSTVILIGYAIPGFVLGIALIVLFGGGSFWNIFPLRGLVSDNWRDWGW